VTKMSHPRAAIPTSPMGYMAAREYGLIPTIPVGIRGYWRQFYRPAARAVKRKRKIVCVTFLPHHVILWER
jgi:hypothetical protein